MPGPFDPSYPGSQDFPRLRPELFETFTDHFLRATKKHAKLTYENLVTRIRRFEATLNPEEEVGAFLVSFNRDIAIHIHRVSLLEPGLIAFDGLLPDGDPVELVQHVTQLSVLLVAVPKIAETPKRIGFGTSETA